MVASEGEPAITHIDIPSSPPFHSCWHARRSRVMPQCPFLAVDVNFIALLYSVSRWIVMMMALLPATAGSQESGVLGASLFRFSVFLSIYKRRHCRERSHSIPTTTGYRFFHASFAFIVSFCVSPITNAFGLYS